MVWIGNGTPEGDKRASRLNAKSLAIDDQISARVREARRRLSPKAKSDLQNLRMALARVQNSRELKIWLGGLRQGIDMAIVNDPANRDVLGPGRRATLPIERLAALLSQIERPAIEAR